MRRDKREGARRVGGDIIQGGVRVRVRGEGVVRGWIQLSLTISGHLSNMHAFKM